LQNLDVSNSSITNIKYPTEATLKTLNLSGTKITSLELNDQSFLTSLNIDNCSSLTSIKISNCESLPSLNIPSSVIKVEISNCAGLNTFSLPYTGNAN
jgi:Leucine-rich repeat (LRR) protein